MQTDDFYCQGSPDSTFPSNHFTPPPTHVKLLHTYMLCMTMTLRQVTNLFGHLVFPKEFILSIRGNDTLCSYKSFTFTP